MTVLIASQEIPEWSQMTGPPAATEGYCVEESLRQPVSPHSPAFLAFLLFAWILSDVCISSHKKH